MDGASGGREGEEQGPGRDTQPSGPRRLVGGRATSGGGETCRQKGRGGNPVWGMLGLRRLQDWQEVAPEALAVSGHLMKTARSFHHWTKSEQWTLGHQAKLWFVL